jgi:hypothetical protein
MGTSDLQQAMDNLLPDVLSVTFKQCRIEEFVGATRYIVVRVDVFPYNCILAAASESAVFGIPRDSFVAVR